MKRWKCTVCGYLHEGEEPPEKCPVCGADRSKFVLLAEDEAKPAAAPPPAEPEKKNAPPAGPPADKAPPPLLNRLYERLTRQMAKNHAHPISVHVPNGVLPAAVTFLFLSTGLELAGFLNKNSALHAAAFYNLIFVVLFMPAVLFSGYVDWKGKFQGLLTRVFLTKMICGASVLIIGAALVVLRLAVGPEISGVSGAGSVYLLLHLLMLAFAAYAGYLGGRIVFKE